MSEDLGTSEIVEFDVGYGKGKVMAHEVVNTSSVPLPNGKDVLVNGKKVQAGYFSHSALEAYTRCAKQFEYKYIKRQKARLMSKFRMWGGTAIHDANDVLLTSLKNGVKLPKETYLGEVEKQLNGILEDYELKFKSEKIQGLDPEPLSFGSRIFGNEQYIRLYLSAASTFYDVELQRVKPLEVEKMFVHHFDVSSGGTVPIVGFIDVVEEIAGEKVITDHKVVSKKNPDTVHLSNQLTLYSMAEGIPTVAINEIALGTTGGQSGKKPKPGEFTKYMGSRTMKDYERVHENIDHVLKGVKAGAFPRSGIHNPMVCAPDQCPYFEDCLGKRGKNTGKA